MLQLIRDISRIFNSNERWRIALLVAVMTMGAFAEAVGVGSLVPFIAMISDLGVIHQNRYLMRAYVLSGAESEQQFMLYACGLLIALFLLKNTFLALAQYFQNRFLFAKEAGLVTRLTQAYLYAPYTYHLNRNSADLVRIATTEVSRVISGVVVPVFTLFAESLTVGVLVAMIVAVEPWIGLGAVGALGLIALGLQRKFKPMMVRYRDMRVIHQAAQTRWVSQALSGLKDVKILRRENYFVDRVKMASVKNSRATVVFTTLNGMPRLVLETFAVIAIVGYVVAVLLRNAPLGPILPTLALTAMVAVRVMPSATRMMNAVNVIRFFRPGLSDVISSLDAAPQSALRLAKQRYAGSSETDTHYFHELQVRDVWYRHPEMDAWILQGVSCAVRRGELVAVVGHSGSGKSTLADLLLGLIVAQQGAVEVDGINVRELGDRWLNTVGYVPQQACLLDDSVRHNVAFGIPPDQIDDDRVWHALEAAQIADKVHSMPGALDAPVGEAGCQLSGGERQRIAVARALYNDPAILIFDEATSALDPPTGRALTATIRALAGEKTIIFITHHLHLIEGWTHVIRIEGGRVLATAAG